MRWLQRIHGFFLSLLGEHTAPGKVALAIAVGCMVGCTPLFGLHLLICVGLSLILRLNKFIVYGTANLSVPPLVPLIGLAAVQLGERLLHGRFLSLTRADFEGAPIAELVGRFYVSWLVGGVLLGALLGTPLALGVYLWLRQRRAGAADEIGAALARAARRYRGLPRKYRIYACMKYRLDPCYRVIAALVPPESQLVDLGTGLGMLPVLLGELGGGRRALGIEWDDGKARCGAHAARGLAGVEIAAADLRAAALPRSDLVTLVDVLHYYEPDAQREILGRAAAALAPGGLLIVRESDQARRGGARLTRSIERWMVRLGWNLGPRVHFRPLVELLSDLTALGLKVEIEEVAGPLHPGNVLLCGRRSA